MKLLVLFSVLIAVLLMPSILPADRMNTYYGTPYGEIYVQDNAVATTLNSAAKAQVLTFGVNGAYQNTTPDHTEDHITCVRDGDYLITVSIAIENAAGAAHVIEVSVYKNNGATELANVHGHRTLSAGTDKGSISLSGIASLSVGDTIELWADTSRASDSDVVFSDITLSMVKL